MAAREKVTLVIAARDATRGTFRRIRSGLGALRSRAVGFLGALTAAAGGIGAAAMLQFSENVQNAADRLRVSTESLQRWQQAANKTGVRAESLNTVFQRIRTRLGEAKDNTELFDILLQNGLIKNFRELDKLSPDEFLLRAAAAAEKAVRSGRFNEFQAQFARIVDSEGVPLLGLLAQGVEKVQEALANTTPASDDAIRAQAKAAEEARKQLEAYQTAMIDLSTKTIPALTVAVERIVEALDAAQELRRQVQSDNGSLALRGAAERLSGAGAAIGLPGAQQANVIATRYEDIFRSIAENTRLTAQEIERVNRDGTGLAP